MDDFFSYYRSPPYCPRIEYWMLMIFWNLKVVKGDGMIIDERKIQRDINLYTSWCARDMWQ